jgi:predicted TIM-barrel fold metal-dependent hydrolase
VHRSLATADELLEEMDWCGIDEALVWCTAQRFDHPAAGNERLRRELAGRPRLHPTLTILPTATGEGAGGEDLADQLRGFGASCVRLFPQDHRYLLDDVTLGDQLEILAALRVPVFISDTLDRIGGLLRSFPTLVVITDALGMGPLDRYAWPLADRYPDLRFETSSYLVAGSIEAFVARYGSSRLVFGSGVPMCVSGASLLQVLHADIADADREAILAGSLERLLADVRL